MRFRSLHGASLRKGMWLSPLTQNLQLIADA
jgi:hypothetical protein